MIVASEANPNDNSDPEESNGEDVACDIGNARAYAAKNILGRKIGWQNFSFCVRT